MSQTDTGFTALSHEFPGNTDLTTSEQYRLLDSAKRRLVLDDLRDQTDPVALEDLAATVSKRDNSLDSSDEETVQQVKARLHHVHLPKLADFGVLGYDAETQQVEPQTE